MTNLVIVGENMRKHRKLTGRSIQGMAEDVGMSVSNLSRIEKGDGNPTVATLEMVAEYLGIPVINLFESPDDSTDAEALSDYDYDPEATYVYYFKPEINKCPYSGKYLTYNINCEMRKGDALKKICVIHDVGRDEKHISALVAMLNRHEIHPLHLRDVIEDMQP